MILFTTVNCKSNIYFSGVVRPDNGYKGQITGTGKTGESDETFVIYLHIFSTQETQTINN